MAEARTKISLDSGSFEKGAKAVTAAAQSMSSGVKAAFATAGAAVLLAFGAKGVSSLLSTVRDTLEFGEAMANAGRKAGLAAGQFYLFNAAVTKGIGLKTAADLLGKNAEVLNRSASLFRDVSIKLWVIGEQIRGFWLGLLERLSPVLSRILDGGLGSALLDAGESFGQSLADAVETIYQLAKDGKLWTAIKEGFGIAFDYAGERLLWLGKISYEVIREAFSSAINFGIVDALASTWKVITNWANGFGDVLGNAIFVALTEVLSIVNKVINKLEKAQVAVGLISQKEADDSKTGREDIVASARTVGGYTPTPLQKDGTFMEKVAKIFEANKFKPVGDLKDGIETFLKGLEEVHAKYKRNEKDNPAKKYENNLPIKTYGADSLAQIGGGGGVYMGLSVLDVNKQQLKEQRRTNEILMRMSEGSVQSIIQQYSTPVEITRGQQQAAITS